MFDEFYLSEPDWDEIHARDLHETMARAIAHTEEDLARERVSVRISRSVHGTTDVVLYNLEFDRDNMIRNWFELVDIWRSRGYDRFGDGGLYFETTAELYDLIPKLPFTSAIELTVLE